MDGPSPGQAAAKHPLLTPENLQKLRSQVNAQILNNANSALSLPKCLLDFKPPGLTDGQDTVGALLAMARERQGHLGMFPGLEAKVQDAQRRLIPARIPLGISFDELAQERERLVKAKIGHRIHELTQELSSMELDNDTDRQKKAMELKMLKLRDVQKQMRESVLKVAQQNTALDLASERAGSYRRPKKQSLRELRQLEKLERQQRLDRNRKERQTYFDYLNAVMAQVKDFGTVQRNNQQKRSKLVRQIMHHHSAYEKEEQRRVEKVAKDRLRALKADDEEAYLKLLDQQKDSRLTHLIKQTDEFLLDLSSKVVAQQNVARAAGQADEAIETVETKGDYYATAHRVQEMVTEQSSL